MSIGQNCYLQFDTKDSSVIAYFTIWPKNIKWKNNYGNINKPKTIQNNKTKTWSQLYCTWFHPQWDNGQIYVQQQYMWSP